MNAYIVNTTGPRTGQQSGDGRYALKDENEEYERLNCN